MNKGFMLNSERGKTVMAFSRPPGKQEPARCRKGTRMDLLMMLVMVLCTSLLGLGCADKKDTTKAEKTINVKVWITEKKPIRPYIEAVGSLDPNEEVLISSEVDGILKNIPLDEGIPVSRGTVLAKVNDIDYRLGVQSAEAALRQAQANLDNAKIVYERMNALFQQAVVSKQEFDNATTRLDISTQDLDRASSALSLARERLAKTVITSPIKGMVKEKMATMGDFAKAGMPLMRIIQIEPVKLTFSVAQKDLGALKKGQDVVFSVDSFPGREFKGTLNIIYPSLDERSRMLKAEAIVPNGSLELKPGLFARVKVYTGVQKEAVLIPVTSILYEGTRTRAFIAEQDSARERSIRLGSKYGEMMEVLEGIQAGEQLVVVGQNTLTDGVKIHAVK